MDEYVEKTIMRTKSGLYKLLIMPFRSCNVLSMFTTLMNSIFHEKLDEFMIIYIDDILVYFKMTKEHVKHLEYVLSKFHENKFFVNRAKNEFVQEKMNFLGHLIMGRGEVQPQEVISHKKLEKPNQS